MSRIGTRVDVADMVRRYAVQVEAFNDFTTAGGWTTPRFRVTLEEAREINPSLPPLPAVAPAQAAVATPVVASALPSAQVQTLAGPANLGYSPARETAREALQARFSNLGDAYGVMVLDAESAVIYEHRATERVQAASLYKLGVAAVVLDLQRKGQLNAREPLTVTRESLADDDSLFVAADIGRKITVGEALDYMITRSSNVAAILLMKRIGQQRVNDLFQDLGMYETRLLERPYRNIDGNAKNQTTPRDMARFFSLLLRGRVVDVETSQAILRLLLQQRIEDRLPAAVPRDVRVAHKTGNLVGVVHDAGIIYSAAGPLIVVVLSQDAPTEAEALSTIVSLARVAHDAYVSGSSQP